MASRQLDNAAPTIFATQSAHRAEGVWSDAYDEWAEVERSEGSEGSGEEGEDIDAQEVFGESLSERSDREGGRARQRDPESAVGAGGESARVQSGRVSPPPLQWESGGD